MRQVRDSGLSFHAIVKSNVRITQPRGDVILEGRLADVNLAISDIKDAVAESVCDASDLRNHVNGSSTSADWDKNDPMAGKQRSAFVTKDTDRDQLTVTDKHQIVDNSHHATASATLEMCKSVDKHVWHYIALKYPDMHRHWEQTLAPSLNTTTKVIEITGQLQDVINFDEWHKRHDLMSVVQRIIEVPSNIDVDLLKRLVDSSEAAEFGVCIRLFNSREMECIGKERDIDGLLSWLNVALRDFKEHKVAGFTADLEDSARVNGSVKTQEGTNMAVNVSPPVNSPVADAGPVAHKRPIIIHADQERLKFKTAESRLEVEVLKGDLTRQKSHAIVNPANKHLLHHGGAAKAIQTAAGQALINECKDYIRKHKELPTSAVMHTTSGKLPRPINYVIHTCGPNARDYPDDKRCLELLKKTFLNCFTYANDTLHVQSLALPAISSGIILILQ